MYVLIKWKEFTLFSERLHTDFVYKDNFRLAHLVFTYSIYVPLILCDPRNFGLRGDTNETYG